VQQRFEDMREALVVLGQSPAQLSQSLPTAVQSGSVDTAAVATLKTCLSSLDRLRLTREAIERELLTFLETDDVTPVLMADDAAGAVEDGVFQAQLQARYGGMMERCHAATHETGDVLARTREANSQFTVGRGSASSERERMVSDLQQKFEDWKELKSNLLEGEKFYGGLTTVVLKYHNKCKDFVGARRTEKTELMSDITKAVAATVPEQYNAHSTGHPPAPAQPSPPPQQQQQQQYPGSQQPPQPQAVPTRPAPAPAPAVQPQQAPYLQQPGYQPPAQSGVASGYPAPQPGYPAVRPYGAPPQQQQQPPQPQQPAYSYQPPAQYGYAPTPQQQPQQRGPYGSSPATYQTPSGPPPSYSSMQPAQPQYPPPAQAYDRSPYAPAPAAVPTNGEWACATCTFHNHPAIQTCEMCGTARA